MAENKPVTKNKKPGLFKRMGKFFSDAKGEFKKVVWPPRRKAINNVFVVAGMVLCTGIVIWVIDFLLGLAVRLLLNG